VSRVVIDPVTRVGGHLRVEADVADGAIFNAWATGTTFRGFESTLPGRDARDAWLLAQRVCGSSTGVHALASVRAVENALGLSIPKNARLIRNIIAGATYVQNHVMHFYLAEVPDWADAASALTADPAATSTLAQSLSDWSNSSAAYFQAAKDRLSALVTTGPLARGPWGHRAFRTPPELNLMLYAHYLDALDWQRSLVTVRTILGGKSPHPQTYLVGGMAVAPEWGGPTSLLPGEHPWRAARHSAPPLSSNGLSDIAQLIDDSLPFVTNVLLPDVQAVAAYYPEWEKIGTGIGHYMSLGDFPLDDGQPGSLLLPRGRVMDRDLSRVDDVSQEGIAETVAHSWYRYATGAQALTSPADAETLPAYDGPLPPYSTLEGADRYSWIKAPRYQDDPMEVGPLARVLVGYAAGVPEFRSAVDRVGGRLQTGQAGMFSVIGRVLARAIEAELIASQLGEWVRELVANLATGDLAVVDLAGSDRSRWPAEASGFGLGEGPQGAIGHWLSVASGRIATYQIVDGNTWNLSPRDQRGRPGAVEQALEGTPIEDLANPVEIGRSVHSFDPCAACAVH
jgi:hydrogenase large subunit